MHINLRDAFSKIRCCTVVFPTPPVRGENRSSHPPIAESYLGQRFQRFDRTLPP